MQKVKSVKHLFDSVSLSVRNKRTCFKGELAHYLSSPSLSHMHTRRPSSPLCMPETLQRILLSHLVSFTAEYFVAGLLLERNGSSINSGHCRCQYFKSHRHKVPLGVIILSKTQEIQNKKMMDSLSKCSQESQI